MKGVSFIKDKLYTIDSKGLLDKQISPQEVHCETEKSLIVMVHGYQFDPRCSDLDNPHWDTYEKNNQVEDGDILYPRWQREINKSPTTELPIFTFGWYSVAGGIGALFSRKWRQGLKSIYESWRHGYWNTYLYAWELGNKASNCLVETLIALNKPVNIICHSLGTHVVIKALRNPIFLKAMNDPESPLSLSKVILLNGAEFVGPSREAAKALIGQTSFFNIVVQTDAILDLLGENAAPDASNKGDVIGHDGIKEDRPDNWTDIVLDHAKTQEWGRENGYNNLQGDNPKNLADHWYSHCHASNWKLYRAILAGEKIDPPQGVI